MSQSNLNSDAVDRFVGLVRTAKDFNSKEIRMSTVDAEQLCLDLTLLLNRTTTLAQKVMELQDRLIQTQSREPTVVDLNGGKF